MQNPNSTYVDPSAPQKSVARSLGLPLLSLTQPAIQWHV